jgi:hypothetical protein
MEVTPLVTNLHIHTPYSFSAFSSIEQAVNLARKESVAALGISDFDTLDGYPEFAEACHRLGVYPCFGMETMALCTHDQEKGTRWNDPGNPGRIYFCGKGLSYPANLPSRVRALFRRKHEAMQAQMREMVQRINQHLAAVGLSEYRGQSLQLDYDLIRATLTKGTVRERHLAKALQRRIMEVEPSPEERRKLLRQLYENRDTQVDVSNEVALQEELRTNLLKAGKPAFVPEDTSGYLSLEAARDLVIELGGIPCYPILADGTKGEPTEKEADPERLADELLALNVFCVEFIPTRNEPAILRQYVNVFHSRGIPVLCGTEHNTPALEPMKPTCKGGVEFEAELKEIFWAGACVIAGHQKCYRLGEQGYIGTVDHASRANQVERLRTIGEEEILVAIRDRIEDNSPRNDG